MATNTTSPVLSPANTASQIDNRRYVIMSEAGELPQYTARGEGENLTAADLYKADYDVIKNPNTSAGEGFSTEADVKANASAHSPTLITNHVSQWGRQIPYDLSSEGASSVGMSASENYQTYAVHKEWLHIADNKMSQNWAAIPRVSGSRDLGGVAGSHVTYYTNGLNVSDDDTETIAANAIGYNAVTQVSRAIDVSGMIAMTEMLYS